MSVRKGDQDQGRLKVITASSELLRYTYERVRGNTFPKSEKWVMARSIWDEVSAAHTQIVRANKLDTFDKDQMRERIFLQASAIAHLFAAMNLIDVCNETGAISDARAEWWTGLVDKVINLAHPWHSKDKHLAEQRFPSDQPVIPF